MASEIDGFLTKQFLYKYNLPFFLWWFAWENHYLDGGAGGCMLDLWYIWMDI